MSSSGFYYEKSAHKTAVFRRLLWINWPDVCGLHGLLFFDIHIES